MAIRFRIQGDLRFISHHDTMRLFERALSRAQLPVRFSEGFNPRPRMSLPLPRPVGVATAADMLVFELCEPITASETLRRLREQMPGGLELLEAIELQPDRKLNPEQVVYEVEVPPTQVAQAWEAVQRVLSSERWIIERTGHRRQSVRSIDLRPLLIEASIQSGVLRWSCRTPDTGSARPGEWLEAFGLDPAEMLHRVRRTAVEWENLQTTAQPPAQETSFAPAQANSD
ncbi:MAG TPA: TIGR03936 family radical SAM-associated protein [Phycisphaerae bacterium]|nr:TIGR03936 family radical SAM-associated protein [Phycisphaerae bacterium]